MLLSDVLLPALWALARGLLALAVCLNSLLRGLGAACSAAAARTAVAAPALRPLLAALFALPPREHIGSRPRPPSILGVVVGEDVQDGDWPAAIEALGRMLSWARSRGFALVLLYEPSGTLQQPHRLKQLELQLLLQRLHGTVALQPGWQPGRKAGGQQWQQQQQQLPEGGMTAVVLSAADGQWPLLAAAAKDGRARGNIELQQVGSSVTENECSTAAARDAAFAAPARLRERLQAAGGPLAGAEPDFVVVTGPTLTLAGFPAWLVRSSEIYEAGPLAQLAAEPLDAAMQRYCRTKQRFGNLQPPAAFAATTTPSSTAHVEGEGAAPGQPLHVPAAWTAAEAKAQANEWQHVLTAAEAEEIVAAARQAAASGIPVPQLTRADFPLPTLGPLLEQFRRNCLHGIGFQLLRGFPVERLSQAETVAGFFGLGLYWGNARSQNAAGHVVGHVKDLGYHPDDPTVRVYQTKAAQPWHVDTCDLVALLCLKKARSGGRSAWVSSLAIYNQLLRERPDLVQELMAPFYYDRKGEVKAGEAGYFGRPVLNFYQGYLTVYYNDRMIREAQRFPEVPRLTAKQEEALQAVTDLANDPQLHLEWDLEPGDIQLLHNWNQLHMRTAFEDYPGFENRRHLLRLHLTHEEARPLDPAVFGTGQPGSRLGVYTDTTVHTAPLDAK